MVVAAAHAAVPVAAVAMAGAVFAVPILYASRRRALATTLKVEPSWNSTAVPMFKPKIVAGINTATTPRPVSYTHLDVYKRQACT